MVVDWESWPNIYSDCADDLFWGAETWISMEYVDWDSLLMGFFQVKSMYVLSFQVVGNLTSFSIASASIACAWD